MLQTKPVLFFLLKAIIIFCILAAPLSLYDKVYGNFYRGISNSVFNKFHKTGFARFTESKTPEVTHIEVGNIAPTHNNVSVSSANADFNTRYRGYIPTVFLMALILASPLQKRRKIFSLITGLMILTSIIMIKQWIHLIYICEQAKWLSLYNFTPEQKERIEWWYLNFANYSGSTLIIVIPVWIIVSFRKNDMEALIN